MLSKIINYFTKPKAELMENSEEFNEGEAWIVRSFESCNSGGMVQTCNVMINIFENSGNHEKDYIAGARYALAKMVSQPKEIN